MRSIRTWLSAGLLVSLLLAFGVLWLTVAGGIRYVAESYLVSRLQHDAETLLAAVDFDPAGTLRLRPGGVDPIYLQPFSGHYFIIQQRDTRTRSRSLWDQDLDIGPMAQDGARQLRVSGPRDQPLLLYINRYHKQERDLTIAVAEDLSPVEASIRRFTRRFAVTATGLLAVLVLLQLVILHRGLAPLRRVTRQVNALERGAVDALDDDVPNELRPLISEINHLLDLLRQRLQRSRHALGDLAHALKRPLTVMHQLGSDPAVTRHPALQATLRTQLDGMQRTIDRTLKQARLAGEGPVAAPFSVERDLPDLLGTLGRIHRQCAINPTVQTSTGTLIGVDREDMLELLGNLLDNAFKWARARISLRLATNGKLTIIVEDDGPGVDQADLAALAARGVRLDEHGEGHGLGLAIVRQIATLYGGEVEFDSSPELGGLRATVSLPHGAG